MSALGLPPRQLPSLALWPLLGALLAGCAAPAPPRPREPFRPAAPERLQARQIGWTVEVRCSLPAADRKAEPTAPARRILLYRSFIAPGQPVPGPPEQPVQTLATGENLSRVVLRDSIAPEHVGQNVAYWVRLSEGDAISAPAGPLVLTVAPPPAAPTELEARVESAGVVLHWSAPSPLPPSSQFVIYRQESGPEPITEPTEIGQTTAPSFTDSSVHPGQRYRYTVRVRQPVGNGWIESADSPAAELFLAGWPAPQPVRGLTGVVTLLPDGRLAVDLSWLPDDLAHLAGYNIYRSLDPDQPGQRLNAQPVLATAFRDSTVEPGRQYFYRVRAVSDRGEEGPAGPPLPLRVSRAESD